jgi:hypothetical protein
MCRTAEIVRILSESELLVMLVTLDVIRNGRSISERHKIIWRRSLGKGMKKKNKKNYD